MKCIYKSLRRRSEKFNSCRHLLPINDALISKQSKSCKNQVYLHMCFVNMWDFTSDSSSKLSPHSPHTYLLLPVSRVPSHASITVTRSVGSAADCGGFSPAEPFICDCCTTDWLDEAILRPLSCLRLCFSSIFGRAYRRPQISQANFCLAGCILMPGTSHTCSLAL